MCRRGLLAFGLILARAGEAVDISAVDAYVRAEMELNQIPGVSLAIVRDGSVLSARAYGVRDLASGKPMTVDTLVELASVSKSFTAFAIAKLQKAGRLELDAPVQRYLPELRLRDRAAAARITVRHLLRHTSGFSRKDDYLMPCCGAPGEFDVNVAVRKLEPAKLRRVPGSAFEYANSNYVLLGAVVERVSGEPFPAYMEMQVFRPLGMTRTTLDAGKARAWGLASQHERRWGRTGERRS